MEPTTSGRCIRGVQVHTSPKGLPEYASISQLVDAIEAEQTRRGPVPAREATPPSLKPSATLTTPTANPIVKPINLTK